MVRFESEKWLADFAESRSEMAFRKVVSGHAGLVLGTAMRKLNGDRGAAEDVMQEVFVLLAKKAGALTKGEVVLSAWLYRQTSRLAANHVRGAIRRKTREERYETTKESNEMNKNVVMAEIDEVLEGLPEGERALVVCRYVEERDYAEIGARFGMSGEAARKKIGRTVERLRVLLENRGLGVSVSSLAVMLVGFSGPRASAALVSQVSGMAVKKGVAASGGMFSVAGILAGAMGVSVVMGGVRMVGRENKVEVMPAAESGRGASDGESVLTRVRSSGIAGKNLSEEEIWGLLEELDGEPQTMVTDLLLEDLLMRISEDRVFEIIDGADLRVSDKLNERLCFLLVKKAVNISPEATLKGLLERGLFKMRNSGSSNSRRLGVMAFVQWSAISLDEASAWLMDNWEELDGLGRKGGYFMMEVAQRRKGPSERHNIDTVADHLGQLLALRVYSSGGFEGVRSFVENLDDQSKVAVWKYVFLLSRPKGGDFYHPELAGYLGTFPDHEPFGELKEVSWLNWYKSGKEKVSGGSRLTKEEYMEALPPELAEEFKKSCLDEIKKDGEGVAE